jgi:hypothetical protein
MIRKMMALCLVLFAVSVVFTGCKKDEPVKDPPVEDVDTPDAPE